MILKNRKHSPDLSFKKEIWDELQLQRIAVWNNCCLYLVEFNKQSEGYLSE